MYGRYREWSEVTVINEYTDKGCDLSFMDSQ